MSTKGSEHMRRGAIWAYVILVNLHISTFYYIKKTSINGVLYKKDIVEPWKPFTYKVEIYLLLRKNNFFYLFNNFIYTTYIAHFRNKALKKVFMALVYKDWHKSW